MGAKQRAKRKQKKTENKKAVTFFQKPRLLPAEERKNTYSKI